MNFKGFIALLSVAVIFFSMAAYSGGARAEEKENPRVRVKTNHGTFFITLFPEKAPITVKNFINYVESKFYNETLIHRVEKGFVIQGGGYTVGGKKKLTAEPIENEADNGLKNLKYTLSMARTPQIDSATSQFFINLRDNPSLDHRGDSPREFGYAVFGKVSKGTDVIDKIGMVKTKKEGPLSKPVEPVIIESMRMIGGGSEEE